MKDLGIVLLAEMKNEDNEENYLECELDDPRGSYSKDNGYNHNNPKHREIYNTAMALCKEKDDETVNLVIKGYPRHLKDVEKYIKSHKVDFDGMITFDEFKDKLKDPTDTRIRTVERYRKELFVSYVFHVGENREVSGEHSDQWTDCLVRWLIPEKKIIAFDYSTRLRWWTKPRQKDLKEDDVKTVLIGDGKYGYTH